MRDDFDTVPVRPPLGESELELRERLRRHVDALAGVIGPRHMDAPGTLETAANYIERELAAVAGETVVRHRFPAGNDWAENLLVERRGTQRPERVIVVGAHYDTVPETPGADDNASAVAMLIEAARVLAGRDAKYTLRFLAPANEEAPHHELGTMGSDHYARHCAAEQGTRVIGMLSLEMVGYYRTAPRSQALPAALPGLVRHVFPNRGDFLAAVANMRSIPLLLRFWRGFRRSRPRFRIVPVALPEAVRDITRSDHRAFWALGIPALMITDTSYLRNPHYHQPTDTPDTLDYDRLARATLGVAGGIGRLAGIRQPVVW